MKLGPRILFAAALIGVAVFGTRRSEVQGGEGGSDGLAALASQLRNIRLPESGTVDALAEAATGLPPAPQKPAAVAPVSFNATDIGI